MRPITAAVLFVVFPNICFAADDASRAEELVKRLVSPNKPVDPKRTKDADFPRSYDHKAQKVVEKAADELLEMGFAAIPILKQHLKDDRYCRTWTYATHHDKTVGEECFRLIDRITDPDVRPDFEALPEDKISSVKGHYSRLGTDGDWHHVGNSYFDLLLLDKSVTAKSVETWWKGFSNKSLDHIHLAAVQRLIAYEESIGFPPDSNRERYLKPYHDLEKQLKGRIKEK